MRFKPVQPSRIPHILLMLVVSLTILSVGENPIIAVLTMGAGGPLAAALPCSTRTLLKIELLYIAVMVLLGFLTPPIVKFAGR